MTKIASGDGPGVPAGLAAAIPIGMLRRQLGLAFLLLGAASCGDDNTAAPDDGRPAVDGGIDAPAEVADSPPGTPDGPTLGADAPPGKGDGVRCGDAPCDPGLVCCLREVGPTFDPTCQAPTDTCSPGIVYRCDGPEDCGDGEVCCGDDQGSSCVPAPSCTKERLCSSPDDCGLGEMCCPPPGPTTPFTYDRCIVTQACPG